MEAGLEVMLVSVDTIDLDDSALPESDDDRPIRDNDALGLTILLSGVRILVLLLDDVVLLQDVFSLVVVVVVAPLSKSLPNVMAAFFSCNDLRFLFLFMSDGFLGISAVLFRRSRRAAVFESCASSSSSCTCLDDAFGNGFCCRTPPNPLVLLLLLLLLRPRRLPVREGVIGAEAPTAALPPPSR